MSTAAIPDPRVPVLTEAITDLIAGYAEVRRVLVEEYGAPSEVQDALLGALRSAADRAQSAITAA
ncbi:MAG TPA: hypothetical protein VNA14_10875 [Mycobacteriales bacterium]|nr:hypothetical protein [Mycobacteriales bacterium]